MTLGKLDIPTLETFLKYLTGDDTPSVQWQTIADRGTNPGLSKTWYGKLDAKTLMYYQERGAGIFVTVNKTDGKGRTGDNIKELRACCADNDEDIDLSKCPLPWSFATVTRRGTNPFWLLQPGESLKRYKIVQANIAAKLGTDKAIIDLARVMRAPGTFHQKKEPILVGLKLGEKPEWRYTIDDINDAFGFSDTPLQVAERREKKVLKNQTSSYMKRLGFLLNTAERRNWDVGQRHASARDTATHFRKLDMLSTDAFECIKSLSGAWDIPEINRLIDWTWTNVPIDPTEVAMSEDPVDTPAPARVYTLSSSLAEPEPEPDAEVDETEESEDPQPTARAGPRPVGPNDVPMTDEDIRRELMKLVDLGESEAALPLFNLARRSRLSTRRLTAKLAALKTEVVKGTAPIDLSGTNWYWDKDGVIYAKKRDDWGGASVNYNEIVSPRPIWVSRIGHDVHNNMSMAEVSWQTQSGAPMSKWILSHELLNTETLKRLEGAPLSAGRSRKLTDYLQDVMPLAPEKNIRVARSVGWSHDRWVWPGLHDEIATLNESAVTSRGTADGWCEGLRALIDRGPAAYIGVIAACVAAGAPYSRLIGTRNPILMISHSTSTGKTTLTEYAMSLWTDPRSSLIVPTGSTERGIQDIAIKYRDLPLGIDEHHLRKDLDLLLYIIGSGQQRKTATRDHSEIWGGVDYWGSAIFCSEHVINPKNLGARARMFQTLARPLPHDVDLIRTIQRSRTQHPGGGSLRYSQYMAINAQEIKRQALQDASALAERIQLQVVGDDVTGLALIIAGGRTLCGAFGLDDAWLMPAVEWFAVEAAGVRKTMTDSPQEVLYAIVTLALSGQHTKHHETERFAIGDEVICWLMRTRNGPHMDINPTSRRVNELLRSMNVSLEEMEKVWLTRGWMERNGSGGIRVKRRDVGYVPRLTISKTREVWNVISEASPKQEDRRAEAKQGELGIDREGDGREPDQGEAGTNGTR